MTSAYRLGSGQHARKGEWLYWFHNLASRPEIAGCPSRTLVTNAGKYGLIKGALTLTQLELLNVKLKSITEERRRIMQKLQQNE